SPSSPGNNSNVGASVPLVQGHHRPRGDSRPRLSSGAKLRSAVAVKNLSSSARPGQPRAAVPTWSVATSGLHERDARAHIVYSLGERAAAVGRRDVGLQKL